LCYGNLQVLCGPCNRGKGNRDHTDWRYRAPASTASVAESEITPACVRCHAPMRRRESGHRAFWGCSRFPKCRGTRSYGGCATARRARR
jgi:hypothetical protein